MAQRRAKRVHEAERVRPCPISCCPRASLHNPPVCSIGVSQNWNGWCNVETQGICLTCVPRCVKRGYTSRWHHLSPSEHYCNDCFDYVYRSQNPGHPYLEEWQERWGSDSYLEPTVKLFFAEHVLPFWLQCEKCNKWRCVQSTFVPLSGDSAAHALPFSDLWTESGWKPFTCSQVPTSRNKKLTCQAPQAECVLEALGIFWLTDLGYMPFLLSSPAVGKVKAYFPDGVGHSPSGPYLTGVKVEAPEEAVAAESSVPSSVVPVNGGTPLSDKHKAEVHAAVVHVSSNKDVEHPLLGQGSSRHPGLSAENVVRCHSNRQKRGGPGTIGHSASSNVASITFEEGYGPSDYFQPFFHPDQDPKARSFRPDTMEPSECEYFPEFSTLKHPTLYLGLRNLVLALWQENFKEPLTVEKCMEHVLIRGLIRVRCQLELGRILSFLTRFAFVNTGILSGPLPSLPHVAAVVRGRPNTSTSSHQQSPRSRRATSPRVVVVGAGPSGLAAAHHLHNLGVKVIVVEARDRIGGRVYDDRSLGVCVGHGAQVVNGCVNNPISLLCEQVGITMRCIGERCDLLTENGYTAKPVEDRCIESLFNALLDDVGAWRQSVLAERHTMQVAAEQEVSLTSRGVSASSRGGPASSRGGPASSREGPSTNGRGGRSRKMVRRRSSDLPCPRGLQQTQTGKLSACGGNTQPVQEAPQSLSSVALAAKVESDAMDVDQERLVDKEFTMPAENSPSCMRKHSVAPVKTEGNGEQKGLSVNVQTFGESSEASSTGEDCCGRGGSPDVVQPSPDPVTDDGSSTAQPKQTIVHLVSSLTEVLGANGVSHLLQRTGVSAASDENSILTDCSCPEDLSLATMLSEAQNSLLSKRGIHLSQEEEQLLHFHLGNLEYSCGATLDKVSAMNWDQNEHFALFAGDHTIMTEGFSSILLKLAEPLDLQLNTLVDTVDYSQEFITVRTTCHGVRQVLMADYVLVTIPLSLLKRGTIEFRPPLPSWKQGAIDRLGAGIIEKVALRFPHRFWDRKIQQADFFAHVPVSGKLRGLCGIFYDMSLGAADGCAVLMTIVSGEALKVKAELTDEELVARVMEILRKLFPDEDVPEPEKWLVSHWSEDPLAGMSYSYVAASSSGEDYDLLAQDLDKRVHFAGEATNRQHPQTVTGAYLSGIREAAKIAEAIGARNQSVK